VPLKIRHAERLQKWLESTEPCIGFCLLCGHPILTVEDLIPGTSSHNCPEGQASEAELTNELSGHPEVN
jgi:hypothetical protein